MILISHRRNTIDQIAGTPREFGAEIDIRTRGNDIIIQHDPFLKGTLLIDWLKYYDHKLLILNVKEEGLEERLIELMADYKIESFFFLDQSFPFLIKTSSRGEKRCAVRLSEYESINTVLALENKVQWVWIDYFTRLPIDYMDYQSLKKAGFSLCIVSPELQGFEKDMIQDVKQQLKHNSIRMDAVCTKYPESWKMKLSAEF